MTHETGDGAQGGSASVESAGDGAFDALAAAVEEGVYRLDAEGRFEAVNDVLGDMVGYDREALIGERLTSLVGEGDAETVEAALREFREAEDGQVSDGRVGDGRRVVDVEASIRTATGEPIPCELRLAAVETEGRFVGTAGALRVGGDRRHEVEVLERERAALASELDEALDRVTDAFFALDDEWRFTYLNDRAEALLDVDREAVVGRSLWEEFEEAVDSTFYEEYHESMERQEPTSFVEYFPPLSTWFEVVAYPSETGLSVYFRDVTDRVRRERELEHYETLVQTVDDGLYAVDEDYRFTLVNDAYCALTGYDREELLGEHISMVVDEETVEMARGLREDLLVDDEAGAVEVVIERADGERVTVESRYAAMPGDEFQGTVGVVRDVSERKAFEETLAALHEASRELHVAETSDDVDRIVMETVTDVLDLSAATLFHYDEENHEMVPERHTSAAGHGLPPLPAGEESLTGHVFEIGEFRAYDDIRETSYVDEPRTDMRAGLFAPVGDDRLLVVNSTEPGAFDERTERLVDILAGDATAALERQERARELRESERRYRTLVDNFPNGAVALYDEECHYVAVGGQMYDRIDLSPEDAVGMTVGERLSGEIAEALESTIKRAFEGESDEVEVTYDGRDFRLQSLPIRDDEGDVNLAMVVTQDVTERKQAEEALEESERRFRTMMEQSPLSTQIFDPDGNVLMVNPAWEELWQAESEDIGEYNVLEDEQLEAKGLMPYLEKGFAGEATQLPPVYYDPGEIGKKGRARWIEAFVYPVVDETGDIREVVLIHNDVTESRERERELEQYETIVETVDDGVYVLDEGRFAFVNEAFAELVGYDREELVGADVSKVTTGEYRDEIEEEVRRLEEGEVSVGTIDTELLTAGGERIPVEARFSHFPLEEGGHGRVGIVRDVSERKERERELERYETAFDTASDVFVTIDEGSNIRDVNPAVADVFGYEPEEIVGEPLTTLMPERMRDRHSDALEQYLETGEATLDWEYVELPGEHRDGHEIPLAISFGEFEYDGDRFFTGIIRDNTERKRAQQQLEEERDMFAEGPAVVFRWEIGEGWPVEYVSENVEEVLGYTPAELESGDVRFTDLLFDEEIDRITREIVENSDETTERFSHEPYRIQTKDGGVRWVRDVTKILRDESGDITGYLGYLVDITERKERERELAEQRERYRGLVESAPIAIGTYDADGRVTYANDAVADLLGADDPDDLVGRDPIEFVHPDDRAGTGERMRRVIEDREIVPPKETRLVGLDGEDRYAMVASAPITQDGEPAAQVVLSDVTDRMEYERALEESEQRYRSLVEHFPNGAVALVDRSLRYHTVGGTPRDIAGVSVEELEGAPVAEVLPQELADELVPEYEAALRGESTEIETEFEGRVFQFQFAPVRDEEGDVFAALGMSQDVTERRRRERELEESEQRYRTLVESYPDGAVAMFDEDLRYTAVGGQLLEAEGIDPEERVGQSIFDLYPDDLVEEVEPHFRAALEGETNSFEVRYRGRDLFNYTLPVGSADGEVFGGMLVVNDVTEQREYERTLERFQTIIETVDDGVYTIDSEGYITMVNAAYARMTGYDREELIGMHASELVDESVHERARDIEEELAKGETGTARLAADLKTADGRSVTAEATFALLPGDDEEYERVAVVRDVTERVEREAELERALDLLHQTEEIADVGGWEIDPETQDIFWTEQLFDILGIPHGEVPPLEEALDAVYHPEDQPIVEEAIEAALESGESFDVEARFVSRDDDEPRWARIQGVPVVEEGEVVSLRGAFQDVTERIERERELRERVEQENAITQLGTFALEEPDLDRLFDRATDLVAETLDNDLCKLLELQPDGDSLALRAGWGWDDGLVGEAILGTEDDSIAGRTLETEEAIVVDDIQAEDPSHRPDLLDAHDGRSGVSVIVGSPQDPWGVLGTYDTERREFSQQDVNFVQSAANILAIAIERASREEELHTRVEQQQVVTDLGKKALEDVDLDRLFEEAVERVAETLDNEYAKVLELLPDGESLLLRSGVGWRDGLVGEGTVGTGDDSQAGHTIRSEQPIVVTDLATEERFSGPPLLTEHGVVSGVSTIIGPYDDPWGVLGTHDTERREFSQQDVNFVQSVANILATAIDRRTREREIESQRNRMAAIVRLSEIVQEVDQAVIEQSTREEIDRLVCTHLVESGEYGAAWVGDVNLASHTVSPRAVAGFPDGSIDAVSFDADGESDENGEDGHGSPTAAAAATGEAQTSRAEDDEEAFPAVARERGYRSMAAVPLAFEDVRYGVLTLFSERQSAFEGYERAVLEQLGRTVGHAINAIDRKQALVGDSFTEIEIRLPGVVESLALDDEGEHSIVVEGTVPASGDRIIQYLTVTGIDPETFLELAELLPGVGEVRQIGGDGPSYRFEVIHDDPPVTSTLASYGGRIESVSFDVPDLRVTAALPPSADIRQIVQTLRTEYPDLRIDAQRTVTREHTSTEEHRNTIEEALTERQRTALMTAFFAGYFEWSRESTGEEVAETLGVSPSTFHQHLRAAQRKVISALFEGEATI